MPEARHIRLHTQERQQEISGTLFMAFTLIFFFTFSSPTPIFLKIKPIYQKIEDMNEKTRLVWGVTKNIIEEIWIVLVILWNLPVGLVEAIWLALTDRSRFKANWEYLKDAIRDKARRL